MWFYLLDLVVFFHWAFMGKPPASRRRRVVLNAENVEDRCVPSATALVSAIPVEQCSQMRVMQDAVGIPVEQLNIQDGESSPR
jgi:hypothetical protein